jgi:hypothetical protein
MKENMVVLSLYNFLFLHHSRFSSLCIDTYRVQVLFYN